MITGKQLKAAIIHAAILITNQRRSVDELNVYPVPDGDTGTNMSMTISAAKRELELLPALSHRCCSEASPRVLQV